VPPGALCTNDCNYPNDQLCDDGGVGSAYSVCTFGTDCIDCGFRNTSDAQGFTWPPSASLSSSPSAPVPPGALCTNDCNYPNDQLCDDGGASSQYTVCTFGTDCIDCGWRDPSDTSSNSYDTWPPSLALPATSPSAPVPPGALCTNDCTWPADQLCDDGGASSQYTACSFGTDCIDCGWRDPSDAPSTAPSAPMPPTPAWALCSGECSYSGDGDCDDGGFSSDYAYCVFGTDCKDCGYRNASDVSAPLPPPVPYPSWPPYPPPMPLHPPPTPAPPGTVIVCHDSCSWRFDGVCDDGGEGSSSGACPFGSDCTDCGRRFEAASDDAVTGGACTNTCAYPSDSLCDDGGEGSDYSICELSTDCADCGGRVLPPHPPPLPPAPPPPPSSPPPPPALPGSACYRWCDSQNADLAVFVALAVADAYAGLSGHSLTFTSNVADVAASWNLELASLATRAPSPPNSEEGLCFDSSFKYVPGCVCHPSCALCGYSDAPTSASQCIQCVDGSSLVIDDAATGAGFCSGDASEAAVTLKLLCYGTCEGSGAPSPPAALGQCTDICASANDGWCDDGGGGSSYSLCVLGTDCADCSVRSAPPAPPKLAPRAPPSPLPPPRKPPPPLPPLSEPCNSSLASDTSHEACLPWCAAEANSCGYCACRACEMCAPRPPPPSLPPAPPLTMIVQKRSTAVAVEAAGSVEDYDDERRAQMRESFAAAVGVTLDAVSLNVTGASVQLLFRVKAAVDDDDDAALELERRVESTINSASAAAEVLGVPVLSKPAVELVVETTLVAAPAPPLAPPRSPALSPPPTEVLELTPSPPPPPGSLFDRISTMAWIIIGASAGGTLLVLVVACLVFLQRKRKKEAAGPTA